MISYTFRNDDLMAVSEGLDIAEDVTGNFYKLSGSQWKRHPYEIKTLSSIRSKGIDSDAFAVLLKGERVQDDCGSRAKIRDFYFICLQDHRILRALAEDGNLRILPLILYILTHELVHIVRFCNFFRSFEAPLKDRNAEEEIVHSITFDILKDLPVPKLDYVLQSYHCHRVCAPEF
jgi:hypothetical protein